MGATSVTFQIYSPVSDDTVVKNHTSGYLDVFSDNTVLPDYGLFDGRAFTDLGGVANHRVGGYLRFRID